MADEDIINAFERLRSGDSTVLEEINGRWGDWIIGALRMKGAFQYLTLDDFDELFNDALNDLWNFRERIDKRAKPSTLLYIFAKRRALDRLRSRQTRPDMVNIDNWSQLCCNGGGSEGNGTDTDDQELKQKLNKLRSALESIDWRYQAILHMDNSCMNGVADSKDIYNATGISTEQVPVYRKRARQALLNKFRELVGEEEGGSYGY